MEYPEETKADEPVRHHSTYTSYGLLVETTQVGDILCSDILVELFSSWQALGVKCPWTQMAVTRFESTMAQNNRLMGEHSAN